MLRRRHDGDVAHSDRCRVDGRQSRGRTLTKADDTAGRWLVLEARCGRRDGRNAERRDVCEATGSGRGGKVVRSSENAAGHLIDETPAERRLSCGTERDHWTKELAQFEDKIKLTLTSG